MVAYTCTCTRTGAINCNAKHVHSTVATSMEVILFVITW